MATISKREVAMTRARGKRADALKSRKLTADYSSVARRRKRIRKRQKRSGAAEVDYMAGVAIGSTIANEYPKSVREYTIKHSEFISNVVVDTSGFKSVKYRVNAADPTTFPWLSNLAIVYEKYMISDLKFKFKTTSPTIYGGVVVLAYDYDPIDPKPDTKQDMFQYAGVLRSPVWQNLSIPFVKTNQTVTEYFCAADRPIAPADVRLSDCASIIVATDGVGATGAIGELWVDYEIKLINPQTTKIVSYMSFVLDVTPESGYIERILGEINYGRKLFEYSDGKLKVLVAGQYEMYLSYPSTPADYSEPPHPVAYLTLNGAQTSSAYGTTYTTADEIENGVQNLTLSLAVGDLIGIHAGTQASWSWETDGAVLSATCFLPA